MPHPQSARIAPGVVAVAPEIGRKAELLSWRGSESARITALLMGRYLRIRGPEELLRHEYVDLLIEASPGELIRIPCRVVRARKHIRDYLLRIDRA